LSWKEIFEREEPDFRTNEPQGGKADRGRHTANLTVAAFCKRQLKPGGRDIRAMANRRVTRRERGFRDSAGEAWLRYVIADCDADSELAERFVGDQALHLDLISTGMREARISKTMLQRAVIGEQEQSFTVQIETPSGIDVWDIHIVG